VFEAESYMLFVRINDLPVGIKIKRIYQQNLIWRNIPIKLRKHYRIAKYSHQNSKSRQFNEYVDPFD
jgi:hypothetical protein